MNPRQIIIVFMIVVSVSAVLAWRRRRRRRRYVPPPCTWSTCRAEWRNDWSPGIQNGRCVKQNRKLHRIYTHHNGRVPCPPTTGCIALTQQRTMCSCTNAYHCPLNAWSTWSGSVSKGTCGQQSRYRDYSPQIRYDVRPDNCNGISSSCGARQLGHRTWCSCKYASCSLGGWSSWSDLPSPVNNHCASQVRRRQYAITWLYLDRVDNCNGVGPQSCPADAVEHREKVITCPALANPAHGSWHRDECRTKSQVCRSVCLLKCDVVNGFQLQGADRRDCLPSGQWSTPWSSYCKDVRPPIITCPQSISVGTDPGKPTATVTIPSASASDNSGQQPTITNDAGASPKEFAVNVAPYQVKYTATDAVGLSSTCILQITVKDLERPRVSSCPKDIKHETNQNEIRVTWEYPVFEDNYDRPPVQLTIRSNRNPGLLFPWGRYEVLYTATDRSGNEASCKFIIEVGPVKCTYFEAPAHGARTCNKKTVDSNNVLYEMVCSIQCKDGYSFADPAAANTYLCQSDGTWNRVMYSGQVPVPVYPKSQRPWPDCAPEENVNAVKKKFTWYTGSCSEDEQAALERIRLNFLEAVRNSPLAKYLLCDVSNSQDCVLENIKVYCGSYSLSSQGFHALSSSGGVGRTITLDIVLKDSNPSPDRKQEAEKLRILLLELDKLESVLKLQASSGANKPFQPNIDVSSAHKPTDQQGVTSSSASTVFCRVGKVAVVMPGDGPELERTSCVQCPVGTYYNTQSETCDNCQEGTFQDRTGQTVCHACPAGTWTVGAHAKNFTQCYDICEPGEYTVQEESGIINCLMCPIGTYQPKFRATKCEPCPSGKTTTKRAATDISDCQ